MNSSVVLPCDITGSRKDLALFLLHPLGAQRDFWSEFAKSWTGPASCVAIDLRSRTDGVAGPMPVSIDEHVADLEMLRRQLGVQYVVPVGCAISSMIAAAYAAKYPDSTRALVLANATVKSGPQARQMLGERAETVRRDGLAAILPGAVERAFLNQPHDARYQRYYAAFANQPAEDYAFACSASALYDAEDEMRRVVSPALVIAGEHDVLLPPALAKEAAATIPGAQFEIMPDTAHFVPYQAASAFASRIEAFLAALS
jgi:pimeloyl-ACP methyl ester carboxylesterase